MKEIKPDLLGLIGGGMSIEGRRLSTNVIDNRIGSNPNYSNEGRSSGGSSSGSSRVICTHFYKKGMLDQAIWRADMAYTFNHLPAAMVRGYHVWAIPYVQLMRRSPLAEKIMLPIAKNRAEELAFQMGVLPKSNWKGKIVRLILEPICFAIGVFAKEQNWEILWKQTPAEIQSKTIA
jgi:hypothetical protein